MLWAHHVARRTPTDAVDRGRSYRRIGASAQRSAGRCLTSSSWKNGLLAVVRWCVGLNERSLLVGLDRLAAKFKKAVQTLVEQPPSDELVGFVCLGSRTRPAAHSEADWLAAIEGVRSFLRHLAAVYLDDANLYNAIKHGLGVRASAATVIFGSHVVGNGPSVEFPESSDWVDDQRSWSLVTRWIDVGASTALIHVAAQMISSMWQIGQFRHLGTAGKGKLFFPRDLRAAALRTPDRPPGIRFSMGTKLIETR